jgi:hypothetical protein
MYIDLAYIMTEIHGVAKLGKIPSKIIMDRGTWNSCVLMLTPTPYGLVQHETKGNMLCGLPVEIDDDKVDYFRVMCEPNKSEALNRLFEEQEDVRSKDLEKVRSKCKHTNIHNFVLPNGNDYWLCGACGREFVKKDKT